MSANAIRAANNANNLSSIASISAWFVMIVEDKSLAFSAIPIKIAATKRRVHIPLMRDRQNREKSFQASHIEQFDVPLQLSSGQSLTPITIAYAVQGALNADKSNAILICHALSGDQYAGLSNPVTGKPGWWLAMVGPGQPLDPTRYCLITPNVIGGCMGSSGPGEINPATGAPYALEFPLLTISDMVRAELLLLDRLGIAQLFAVIGGSLGGMRALAWSLVAPGRVARVISLAASARHTAQNIAFNEIGRHAIMSDPDWRGGTYHQAGVRPAKGLAIARMLAHMTYLAEPVLAEKFGRTRSSEAPATGFAPEFAIEHYLHYQGASFVERFDANSYLYLTRAMDYFDLAAEFGDGELVAAFRNVRAKFCIVAFSSDWLFPPVESRLIVTAFEAANCSVSFAVIDTPRGHDAFLLDEPELRDFIADFLAQ